MNPICPVCKSTYFGFVPVNTKRGGLLYAVYCTDCKSIISAEIVKTAERPEVYRLIANLAGSKKPIMEMHSVRPFMSFHIGETFKIKRSEENAKIAGEGVEYRIIDVNHEIEDGDDCPVHIISLKLSSK